MNNEIELKLALSPEGLKRLRRHPLVRSLASSRATTRTLVSTYFDTPEGDLRKQGMALRIRQVGKQRIQTLKALADSGARSLKQYREYEHELEGDSPDLSLIDDEALRSRFQADGLLERLAPVFTTTFQRAAIPLRFADSELELALDEGEITAGQARVPICEAELELLSGHPARIYELALALGERIPFSLERRTKAARGYALGEETRLEPARAEEVDLDPAMSQRAAFELAARSCLTQIVANEPLVRSGGDPEGVHQMRVGVRRLRALLPSFRFLLRDEAAGYLKSQLKDLQNALGPAREWDVFILETLRPLALRLEREAALLNGEAGGLSRLIAAAEALNAAAYEAARSYVAGQRYTELLLRLDLWLEDGRWAREVAPGEPDPGAAPVGDLAGSILDKRDRRLRKLSKKHRRLAESEMHEIRLLGKKMRYSLEFFGSLYPGKKVRGRLAALKSLQDSLGTYNDAVVGAGLLVEARDAALAQWPGEAEEIRSAAALVRGWQLAGMDQDIATFAEVWDHYEAGPRFWRK